jgi:UDP-N-acetylglucosamine:LPS N-acetylglucosamine transferase
MNEEYLRYRIMRLLEEKGRLAAMRTNAARIARPLAAETILRNVMADLQLRK